MTTAGSFELPGPRAFSGSVLEDLRGGSSVVVHLPEHVPMELEPGLWRHASALETYRPRRLDLSEHGGAREPAARLLHRQFAPVAAGVTCSAKSLAEDERFAGWLLFISGLDATSWPYWRDFLREYAHASRSRTLRDRSVFLVCLHGPQSDEPPEADVALSIRRWSDVIGRVDIQILIAGQIAERISDPLLRRVVGAVVVELAAFDAQLAVEVCTRSIEDLMSPLEVLNACARARGWHGAAGTPCWASGRKDAFEDAQVPHSAWLAASGDSDEIARRVWQGQVGSLFPFLEEQRRRVIRHYSGQLRVPMSTTAAGVIEDVRDLELGHVLHQLRRARASHEELRAIEPLNEARHALAHFEPVGAALLRRCAATRGRFAR